MSKSWDDQVFYFKDCCSVYCSQPTASALGTLPVRTSPLPGQPSLEKLVCFKSYFTSEFMTVLMFTRDKIQNLGVTCGIE